MKFTAKLLSLCSLLVSGVFFNSALMAQSQGPNGFDWIGTNTANIENQRCTASVHFADIPGPVTLAATSWVAPGNSLSRYEMTNFEFVGGAIPAHTYQYGSIAPLQASTDFRITIYDSFESMQQDPRQRFRALFHVAPGDPALSPILSTSTCRSWVVGYTYPMQCGRMRIDLDSLKNRGAVEYRDTLGYPTSTPFTLVGGQRYFITLTGDSGRDANGELLNFCSVRTNLDLAANRSEVPVPTISFPLSPTRCAEAGVADCIFRLSHGDYYWQTSTAAICNIDRTPVNYYEGISQFPPYYYPSNDGNLPRTCGGATNIPCCERTMPTHWAYKLGIRRASKTATGVPQIAREAIAVPYCPNC